MDTRHLLDAIVRQTTVLIAQLSTVAGIRAPLAQVADQVFLELARELESQGIGRKVAADMFGLALRSYQKKITRLSESVTQREQTLWSAVLAYLQNEGGASRRAVLERFRRDASEDVAAVLRDLVESGLVSATGRGEGTFYEVASEEARSALASGDELDAVLGLLWLAIYDHRRIARDALLATVHFEPELAERALARLVEEGRVERADEDGREVYSCARVHIPVGASQGWEAAVFDHFRAMANAIAGKLRANGPHSQSEDRIGGATLTFRIHPGHPHETEVLGLLQRVRGDVNELWDRVSHHNQAHPVNDDRCREVTFYMGQNVVEPADGAQDRAQDRAQEGRGDA